MQRAGFVFIGILMLSLIATGLSEATLMLGHRGALSDEHVARVMKTPLATVRPVPSLAPTPSVTASMTATAVPTPTAAPQAVPSGPTATTVSFVHMRAGASTATAIVTDLNAGTVVSLGKYVDSQWQQVSYGSFEGYVYRAYLRY